MTADESLEKFLAREAARAFEEEKEYLWRKRKDERPEWEQFFDSWGDYYISFGKWECGDQITIEELFQHFKSRLAAEAVNTDDDK